MSLDSWDTELHPTLLDWVTAAIWFVVSGYVILQFMGTGDIKQIGASLALAVIYTSQWIIMDYKQLKENGYLANFLVFLTVLGFYVLIAFIYSKTHGLGFWQVVIFDYSLKHPRGLSALLVLSALILGSTVTYLIKIISLDIILFAKRWVINLLNN